MLHAILRAPRRAAPLPDPGLRWIEVDGVAALVADLEPASITAADPARLTRYADLIALIHRDETLIPMRFGCLLASDQEVRALLARRREQLCALLAHLDDCVEFGVRLLPPVSAAATPGSPGQGGDLGRGACAAEARPAGPGRGYLAALRERLDRESRLEAASKQVRQRIEDQVAGLFRDVHEEQTWIAGRELVSFAFLTPRHAADAFVRRLREATHESLGRGFVTGPWPPYHFVGAIDDDLRSQV